MARAKSDASERYVIVGQFAGPHGIKGWIKILSYTDPRSNLFDYTPWHIQRGGTWSTLESVTGRQQGKGWIAKLHECDDRTEALNYKGLDIAVLREQLPPTLDDEYYWTDLIGLTVITTDGVTLGDITEMLATGANDVMIAGPKHQQHLIPFVMGQVIKKVDLDNAQMIVDWDPDF